MTPSIAQPALPADWRDLVALTKPRVMSLVVFTGLCGLLAAPVKLPAGRSASPQSCASRSARAQRARSINGMRRISTRRCGGPPTVRCRRGGWTARPRLHFGVGLSVFSVMLMDLATNYLAAVLLAVSILFYVLVYTVWLKRRTAQNIVIGGAAGAFPPLIGWVAATGRVELLPVLLFAIIFLWTPPHFWALSLFVRSDYAAANVPMLPVVAGIRNTRLQILLYSVTVVIAAIAPYRARPDGPDLRHIGGRPQHDFRHPRGGGIRQPRRRAERHEAGATAVRFLDPLSLRLVRARSSSIAGWSHDRTTRRRNASKRQRERARLMAWLLGAFVVLLFLITVAKIGLNK